MRAIAACFIIGSICFGASNAAADGAVIPLSAESKKALAALGEGVVGEAVPAKPIEDPVKLFLQPGTFKYKVVGKSGKDATYTETFAKTAESDRGATWTRTHPDFVDHIKEAPGESVLVVTELDTQFDYLVHLDPRGSLLVHSLKPGGQVTSKADLKVYKPKDPTKEVYHGTMSQVLTYEGAYKVTTPAGTFDAMLIRDDFKIHVGPAKVDDLRYGFYVEGVGKVAGIERLSVSALMIYHSNDSTPIVLVEHPSQAK